MRGNLWNFNKPRDPQKVIRFENDGETFSAMYKAKRWLSENGYVYGSTDIGPYIPAMKGERYELPQKLHNFDIVDYLSVNAVCYSNDYREGWVEVWLVEPMYIIDLVLTYKWYDMILSGEKKEEYRDLKKWHKRLGKPFTHVRFHRGYTMTTQTYKIDAIKIGRGNPEWGAPMDKDVIIIKLGEIKI